MDHLIKDLMEKLLNRKKRELASFMKYKDEEIKDLILISSGKLMELDYMINELKVMTKNKSKRKSY